jgi:hypothetical protein
VDAASAADFVGRSRPEYVYNLNIERGLNPRFLLPHFIAADTYESVMRHSPIARALLAAAFLSTIAPRVLAAPPRPDACTRVAFTGMVSLGQEWKTPLGEGWVFRFVPIVPGPFGYTGWDLVVDRDPPSGYPDALLLATPPYSSINEREIGTTFGLRAQDAIGWNPRSFHFLTDPDALREGQKQFRALGGTKIWTEKPEPSSREQAAEQRLLEINRKSSPGQFRILNARLTPGIADAAPFAQKWALQSSRTPHTIAPSATGQATPLGQLEGIRFSITLWLPKNWRAPSDLKATPASCPQ